MRRNDLTPEEFGFARLLQSLERDPVAPDAEFLRRLKETTTAAFLAAQPAQQRVRPIRREPRPDPVAGRQRMRSVRYTIFSSIAALLFIGMVSPVLYPARGVELGVAMLNLTRASSAEIQVRNAAGSNTMSFARDEDTTLHWRVDYASGNAEVSNGGAAYFVNRDNNSVHPSPAEPSEVPQLIVEEKLLASLNVNDPAVQSSLLKQRPQSQLDQNGQRLYVYNFQAPAVSQPGERLTVNATVDAATNTLVAMDSEVVDSAGRLRFKANADVTALNLAVPISRFVIDPQAQPSEQIAMVEDVQGQAVVDDVERLLAAEALDSVAMQTGPAMEAVAMSAPSDIAAATTFAAPPESESMPDAIPESNNATDAGPAVAKSQAADKLTAPPTVAAKGMARDGTGALPGNAPAGGKIPGGQAPGREMADATEKPARKKGLAPVRDVAEGQLETSSSESTANRTRKPMAKEIQRRTAPASEPAAKPLESAQPLAGAAPPPPSIAKDESNARKLAPSPAATRQIQPTGPPMSAQLRSQNANSDVTDGADHASPPSRAGKDRAQLKSNAGLAEPEMAAGFAAEMAQSAPFGQTRMGDSPQSINRFNQSLAGNVSRNGAYSLTRRQVAAQTELRPGGILTTDVDAASVVWARLANDADIVVGPGSEVRLLKPTEVQLQSGELLLDIPAGDQVDLLGPESLTLADAKNTRASSRNYLPTARSSVSRQQVTGRGVFRIERNQLQRVEEDPAWLVDYYAKQAASGQNTRSLSRQAGGLDREGRRPSERMGRGQILPTEPLNRARSLKAPPAKQK